MPMSLNLLMFHGIPIGSRRMTNSQTGEFYFKQNGLKVYTANLIAEYIISIQAADRKDIIDTICATSRPDYVRKILEFYQKLMDDTRKKNAYLIKAGKVVVCDDSGVLR